MHEHRHSLAVACGIFTVALATLRREGSAHGLKYLLVGGFAWVVDVAVFMLLFGSMGIAFSQLGARVTGALTAFIGHKLYVFDARDLRKTVVLAELVRYGVLWVVSYAVSTLALLVLVQHGGTPPLLAKVAVEACIVVFNYLVMRSLVFGPESRRRHRR